MNRIAAWLLTTLTGLVLLFGYHTSTSGPATTLAQTVITSGSTGAGGTAGSSAGSQVTGSVAQTRWGPVQVRISVAAATITDVAVVEYPSGNSRDDEINGYALPILIQETLQAQSADVDMVSGATITSAGYQQSLQSALDQAGL